MLYGARIGYQIATYEGETWVSYSDLEIDDDALCQEGERRLSRECHGLPFGYRHFWVIERDIA